MFQVIKNEPTSFIKARKKVKLPKIKSAWEDKNISSIRQDLRKYILENEQDSLCVYCEKKITFDKRYSNIDHFKTRNIFPEKSLVYNNLLVSCNTYNRCSSVKDNKKQSIVKSKDDYLKIVDVVVENPDNCFDYLITGEIVAVNSKGQFTIDTFNLNDSSLIERRLFIFQSLKYFGNLSLAEIYTSFGYEYKSFIKSIYPKLKEL
ncbi:MAG: Unknown protein [uncultured Sulfurovum sp.]|uniref:TIGR02646 family protein n=1 Tax=uncultured Sulfurovum sp. TaxID=269237 RepID=A0A6S6TPN6_9BACT|nr:MAG: Unknown protein [uncultured Sulfurovum sp.]